jgi:hypothetical protein
MFSKIMFGKKTSKTHFNSVDATKGIKGNAPRYNAVWGDSFSYKIAS